MSDPLSPELHQGFAQLMRQEFGLRFDGVRQTALDYGVQVASRALGMSPEVLLARARQSEERCTELLVQALTVGETYFFREPLHFHWLREYLRKATRPVRLWSAGCATGEEPYTMAIVALDTLGAKADQVVQIVATDLNIPAIERARRGEYRAWSFRGVAADVRMRWFEGGELDFKIRGEVQKLVDFRPLNLTAVGSSRWWPDAVDVAFCRNLTPYLDARGLYNATQGLAKALRPDGVVICASADPWLDERHFCRRRSHGVLTYHRWSDQSRVTQPTHAPAAKKPFKLLLARAAIGSAPGPAACSADEPAVPASTVHTPPPPPTSDAVQAARDTASVLARRGEVQLAVQQLSVLLQGQPFDTASYLLRAQFQQMLGAHAEAVRDARRALLTDSSSVYAHILIAFSALSTGRLSLARSSIRSGQRLLQAASGGPPTAFSDDLTRDDMSNLLATLARTMSHREARDS